jgi:CO/xanthine dehydrogenase Mo-binding subunit
LKILFSTNEHRYLWPKKKVCFVGEPVAMVVAESRYIAGDALEMIWVDYEPLPAVVDLEQALTAESA